MLHKETILKLFSIAGPALIQNGETVIAQFVCAILEGEGPVCYLAEELNAGLNGSAKRIDQELTEQIVINELSWKFVERAGELRVRCHKPLNKEEPLTCEYLRWGKWESLPIE